MIWWALGYFAAGAILFVPSVILTMREYDDEGKKWGATENFATVAAILIWPIGLVVGLTKTVRGR